MKRLIIAFSGVDGAGKSTQIGMLEDHLRARGHPVARFWARGGYTPLFSAAKAFLRRLQPSALPPPGHSATRDRQMASPVVQRVWLTLAMLDLALCYGVWLRWRRFRGFTVLCDRYVEDTALDFRRHFPEARPDAWWLWRLVCRLAPRPDAGILLVVPVDESLRRSRLKDEPFPDSAETLAWRLQEYEELARSGRWHRLDARRSREEVQAEIRTILQA